MVKQESKGNIDFITDKHPQNIPSSWTYIKLDKIARVINGRAYKKQELLEEGPIPVLRVGNLFTSNKWYYSDLNLEDDKYCDEGDLLFAWSASFGPRIWEGPRVIYHYHIWKIVTNDELIEKEYLYYYLEKETKGIKSQGHGTSMIHFTKKEIENKLVPIPPLEEQKRIVKKIKHTFSVIDELQSNIKQTKQLLNKHHNSLLRKAFRGELLTQKEEYGAAEELLKIIQNERNEGKNKKELIKPLDKEEQLFEVPFSWLWVRLGDISEWKSGGTPSRSKKEFFEGDIPWYKAKELNFDYLDKPEEYITQEALEKSSAKITEEGSLLVGMYDTAALKLGISKEAVTCNQAIAFTKFTNVSTWFVFYWLKHIRPVIMKRRNGVRQQNLSLSQIKEIEIPLPPIAEQKRIVNLLKHEFEKEKVIAQQLENAEQLLEKMRESLLRKAFRGELVEHRPKKEQELNN